MQEGNCDTKTAVLDCGAPAGTARRGELLKAGSCTSELHSMFLDSMSAITSAGTAKFLRPCVLLQYLHMICPQSDKTLLAVITQSLLFFGTPRSPKVLARTVQAIHIFRLENRALFSRVIAVRYASAKGGTLLSVGDLKSHHAVSDGEQWPNTGSSPHWRCR